MAFELHDPKLIRECCAKVADIPGDAAEIGVYQGSSAKLICQQLPMCTVHLFDTYAGMPDICVDIDGHKPGDWKNTSLDTVQKALNGYANYRLHPGTFPQTAIPLALRFVHVDCDIYRSTVDALEWAWANLTPGGIILDDDYNSSNCKGAHKAVDEFVLRTRDARLQVVRRRAVITKPITSNGGEP